MAPAKAPEALHHFVAPHIDTVCALLCARKKAEVLDDRLLFYSAFKGSSWTQ